MSEGLYEQTAAYAEDMALALQAKDDLIKKQELEIEMLNKWVKDLTAKTKRFDQRVNEAVNVACTCGGDGPDNCCSACTVWHLLNNSSGD